jgi:hypothetical protein
MPPKIIQPPCYYAYYDKPTGSILSITNEKTKTYKHSTEISYDVYERLVSGKEKFTDYVVGHLKTDDGQTILTIIPKTDQAYVFKNTMFEWISNKPNKKTELIVEWNFSKKAWDFSLSSKAKDRVRSTLVDENLLFFVVLESDLNFLIRTIVIKGQDLISRDIQRVPFVFNIESQISKISIVTKLTFESCGLKIND